MTMYAACPRCGTALPNPALVCPTCHALVFGQQLQALSAEAQWQEEFDPTRAIATWQRCLALLPPESGQYQIIANSIARLERIAPAAPILIEPGQGPTLKQDSLAWASSKTGLSMAVSILVYGLYMGWPAAVGFVLLIFVHEMGHVVANQYYGLPASPPIFIPFLGAVINLRKAPPNARVEAIVGIAGPIAGMLATLACLAWYHDTHLRLAALLTWFGATMNLFNLLPVPPLDGGRVAAAISPWIWILGLAGMGYMLYHDFQTQGGNDILILVLIFALPRIISTLRSGGRSGPYYAIGNIAPFVIGASYLALCGVLILMRLALRGANLPF